MADGPTILHQNIPDERKTVMLLTPDYSTLSESDIKNETKQQANDFMKSDVRKARFVATEHDFFNHGSLCLSQLELQERIVMHHKTIFLEKWKTMSDERRAQVLAVRPDYERFLSRTDDYMEIKKLVQNLMYSLANSSVSVLDGQRKTTLIDDLLTDRTVQKSEERHFVTENKPGFFGRNG